MMFERRKPYGPNMMQQRGCTMLPFAPVPMAGPAPRHRKPRPMGGPGPGKHHRPMPAQGRGCFMM